MNKYIKCIIAILCIACLATGCSFSGQTNDDTDMNDEYSLVDFIVEVKSGKEPIILQLTDPPDYRWGGQERYPGRLEDAIDVYWGRDKKEERCYSYIRETIQQTKPDLILLTGDIVYGEFDDGGIKENPINIYTHPNKEETDFGYLGRPLKNAWDSDYAVWNSMKALGAEAILVGHEHCNSASVVYDGVRLQYGQKISTYDRANFVESDGTIIGAYYGDIAGTRTPLMGGTVLPLSATDGSITKPYIYLCGDAGYTSFKKIK